MGILGGGGSKPSNSSAGQQAQNPGSTGEKGSQNYPAPVSHVVSDSDMIQVVNGGGADVIHVTGSPDDAN